MMKRKRVCQVHILFLFVQQTLKMPYFQRKHKEKYTFPLVIRYFLLYLQRNYIIKVTFL